MMLLSLEHLPGRKAVVTAAAEKKTITAGQAPSVPASVDLEKWRHGSLPWIFVGCSRAAFS